MRRFYQHDSETLTFSSRCSRMPERWHSAPKVSQVKCANPISLPDQNDQSRLRFLRQAGSVPPRRKQPYRTPQSQNNQNPSGNIIASMHAGHSTHQIATFPRRAGVMTLSCSVFYAFPRTRRPPDLLEGQVMSALGQKRTLTRLFRMSALPPKADMDWHDRDVRFVPKADIR